MTNTSQSDLGGLIFVISARVLSSSPARFQVQIATVSFIAHHSPEQFRSRSPSLVHLIALNRLGLRSFYLDPAQKQGVEHRNRKTTLH